MSKTKMPKGIFPRKPFTQEHKDAIRHGQLGNQYSKGKNLGNRNAFGKTRGAKNGNWKGGSLTHASGREARAGRPRSTYCEVCFLPANTDFDHDHATNLFRGWLCRRCNLVLGMVKDDSLLLRNLAMYLDIRKTETRPPNVILSLLQTYGLPSDNGS